MTIEYSLDLSCHPSTRTETVRAIQVLVRRSAKAELQLAFRLHGDIPSIRVPSPDAARIGSQLWLHTCFEAFIAVQGQPAYHEFNFAPSGEWTILAFRGYRDRGAVASEMRPPQIGVRATQTRLELDALVRLDDMSAIHSRAPLRLGLSAVIEANDRTLSYWALHHPADKPDFHNADAFALRLEPPRPR